MLNICCADITMNKKEVKLTYLEEWHCRDICPSEWLHYCPVLHWSLCHEAGWLTWPLEWIMSMKPDDTNRSFRVYMEKETRLTRMTVDTIWEQQPVSVCSLVIGHLFEALWAERDERWWVHQRMTDDQSERSEMSCTNQHLEHRTFHFPTTHDFLWK